ncbi:MAG: tRNA (adenosine(37)-N6)-threonylcarbamoyltransferase complex dimerization subunit type 1 TsaB [Erysipelotrichaceae bacterium]|nr:tRNA (adenosine(37)-N6)-threonylcarbamoyltransferase complex dimerization subunit type 1 TsaB [Erysipelotrichaceae bacterium]MDY5251791.1 tRNA (adenosine(37)-N6)-threonylcarbamoyltransferase complex dimerization subunit type 1 TsaB [Erysipelotrichaceae bacterium]
MITLALDTSHKHLVVALLQDDQIIASICEYCPKKQSELILVELERLCKENNIKPFDIQQVVITKGPGSYTGVRIAMTVAKVICAMRNIPLYTISTIDLLASDNCLVLMDARGQRAYYGKYQNGQLVGEIAVDTLDNIKLLRDGLPLVADGSLLDETDNYPDLAKMFVVHKDKWQLESNVHTVVPMYLKDATSYMVKK